MKNASIAIQILPFRQENEKNIEFIDKIIEYIKSTGITYTVTPFETVFEGEILHLLEIMKRCFEICIELKEPKFMAYIKLAYDEKGVLTIDEKVKKHSV